MTIIRFPALPTEMLAELLKIQREAFEAGRAQARAELIAELRPVAYLLHTGHGTSLRETIPACDIPAAWKALAIIPKE